MYCILLNNLSIKHYGTASLTQPLLLILLCKLTPSNSLLHTHTPTHSHTHSTLFSRWEPCCIPLQFKNCCCQHHSSGPDESTLSCRCLPFVPIGPSRCIIRCTDSVPENLQVQSLQRATENVEDDPQYKCSKNPLGCICCTRIKQVQQPEICVSVPNPERAPLLEKSTSRINSDEDSTAGNEKPYHVYSWYVHSTIMLIASVFFNALSKHILSYM